MNPGNKGFTLIELLIVVSIIGILSAVAVTSYVGVTKKAARSEAEANLNSLRLLEEQYYAENAIYAPLASLTGFKPGPGGNYTYNVVVAAGAGLPTPVPVPYDGSTVALPNPATPCFIARANGIPGTRVCPNAANCDVFAIDCNNNRNY